MGDYILERSDELIVPPEAESGKSMAIVGSGPAGLSAAFYLRRAGHRVTIFDRVEEPVEMLAGSVKDKRLSRDIMMRVVRTIEYMGVEFRLKVDIGRNSNLSDLKKDFDGLLIAAADETDLPSPLPMDLSAY